MTRLLRLFVLAPSDDSQSQMGHRKGLGFGGIRCDHDVVREPGSYIWIGGNARTGREDALYVGGWSAFGATGSAWGG